MKELEDKEIPANAQQIVEINNEMAANAEELLKNNALKENAKIKVSLAHIYGEAKVILDNNDINNQEIFQSLSTKLQMLFNSYLITHE